ncbi:hypothetical protein ACFW2D_28930 [Streptomyces sp. NPDC058914]|uniref:hypothetical protein n=1 Tax=Streptomyces sp. NPDC058914 TaxID=3346671 RepID=UPI0036C0DF0B
MRVAGHLRPAAAELVPGLSQGLGEADFLAQWSDMSTGALVSTLVQPGDPASVPALVDVCSAATG